MAPRTAARLRALRVRLLATTSKRLKREVQTRRCWTWFLLRRRGCHSRARACMDGRTRLRGRCTVPSWGQLLPAASCLPDRRSSVCSHGQRRQRSVAVGRVASRRELEVRTNRGVDHAPRCNGNRARCRGSGLVALAPSVGSSWPAAWLSATAFPFASAWLSWLMGSASLPRKHSRCDLAGLRRASASVAWPRARFKGSRCRLLGAPARCKGSRRRRPGPGRDPKDLDRCQLLGADGAVQRVPAPLARPRARFKGSRCRSIGAPARC